MRQHAAANLVGLTFSPAGKRQAIEHSAVPGLCAMLGEGLSSPEGRDGDCSSAVRAAAAAAAMNLCTDNTAKVEVIDAGGLDGLVPLLDDGERPAVQVNALKAIAAVSAHPKARAFFNNKALTDRLHTIADCENSLLARNATIALGVVEWAP